MNGLSVVRMISAVGVRLMVRTGSGGHPTDRWQDKSRKLRPGRSAEEASSFNDSSRCALPKCEVHIRNLRTTSTPIAHRIWRRHERGR